MKRILIQLISDESNQPSSKRIVGIICSLTLCITCYHNSFSEAQIAPAEYLVDAVALLAFGCLGLSSIDKWTHRKSSGEDSQKTGIEQ